MTTKLTITRMVKTMMPMMKFPAMTKLPNACITMAGGVGPLVAARRDKAGRGEVKTSRSMVAIGSTVGKGGKFQRAPG